MPSAEHDALVEALTSGNPVASDTLDDQRANYRAMLCGNPIDSDITIESTTVAGCDADWVSAPNSRADHAVLYFHGGGYVIGDNVAYREFASRIARATAARVCVLNYRLAPENPFPAAVDDAANAYRELLGQGLSAQKIALAGDSAGGGLAMAALAALRESSDPLPACGVCFSPWTDLTGSGATANDASIGDPLVSAEGLEGMSGAYAPSDKSNPLASPLNADMAGFPPLQMQTGTREILLDDSRRAVEKARGAGVTVDYFEGEGLIHVWPVLAPTAPESVQALARMAEFTGQHWT